MTIRGFKRSIANGIAIVLCGLAPAGAFAQADRTPPIAPKVSETPLPAPVTLPPPPVVAPDVPSGSLTPAEAVEIALRHQASVTAARGALNASRGRTQQANAGLLPTLGLSLGYTQADTISGTGATSSGGSSGGTGTTSSTTSTGFQANATARQLLFDFQHTRNLARQARALERAAFSNLTKVQADLVLQVKQGFYGLAQSVRLVTVNEANLVNAHDHLALAKARLNAGLGLPSDVVRAETAVSDAALTLNLAQNASSLAGVTLASAMGIDVRTPLTAADSGEPSVEAEDVNALVETALRDRPEVQQAQANIDAALAALRAYRTNNAPSLGGTVGVAARDTNFFPHNDSLTVGATVQWNVFDAGATSGRTREAEGNVQTAQALVVTARQNAAVDVAQAYLNLRSAEQRVVTAEAEVANALEGVRLAEGRYRSGLGTFIEVTDAQSALLAAQTNKVNAQASVDIARATMAHAIGANLK